MLMQTSLCSSIGTTLCPASECQDPIDIYDWVHSETHQMFEEYAGSQSTSQETGPSSVKEELDDDSCQLNLLETYSKQPTETKMSSSSPYSLVYTRRRLPTVKRNSALFSVVYTRKKSKGMLISPSEHPITSTETYSRQLTPTKTSSSAPYSFVYTRRKLSAGTKRCALFSTVYKRKKLTGMLIPPSELALVTGCNAASIKENVQDPNSHVMPVTEVLKANTYSTSCNNETDVSKSVFIQESSAWFDDSLESYLCKSRDVNCSTDDSCFSSKSILDLASASMRMGVHEPSEYSSSGAITDKEIPAKEFCVLILKNHGLLEGAQSTGMGLAIEESVGSRSSNCYRLCKHCHKSDAAGKLLICDNCEEAFHIYCCNVHLKKINEDEWFCPSCSKKKRKALKRNHPRPARPANGVGNCGSSKGDTNAVALMLRDTDSYTTGVRIGKNFQAEVPDWSGPTFSDTCAAGEPIITKPEDHVLPMNAYKPSMISNWLQCREEDVDGTVCGKWRRAPLSEVQTDDWECYCAVFWDPARADCAVPQELETEDILKQLKYVEMLRPRLAAQRRKQERSKHGGS